MSEPNKKVQSALDALIESVDEEFSNNLVYVDSEVLDYLDTHKIVMEFDVSGTSVKIVKKQRGLL